MLKAKRGFKGAGKNSSEVLSLVLLWYVKFLRICESDWDFRAGFHDLMLEVDNDAVFGNAKQVLHARECLHAWTNAWFQFASCAYAYSHRITSISFALTPRFDPPSRRRRCPTSWYGLGMTWWPTMYRQLLPSPSSIDVRSRHAPQKELIRPTRAARSAAQLQLPSAWTAKPHFNRCDSSDPVYCLLFHMSLFEIPLLCSSLDWRFRSKMQHTSMQ
jgi:hypothetical protein